MISLPLPPKITHKKSNHAVFEIEGLYPGYGVTIGNSLRRVLLSSLEGVAVTELSMKGVAHEFSTIPGVLEDAVMVSLNAKNLRFKIFEGDSYALELSKKGEGKVTGADFKLPAQVELANPDLHLATITDKGTDFKMEIKDFIKSVLKDISEAVEVRFTKHVKGRMKRRNNQRNRKFK